MFRRERGVVYGVMNDFDLGQISDVEREGYKGERTGTRPFMSISLHLGRRQTQIPKHIERFDLESVFYVMFWEAQLSNNGELYATKAAKDESSIRSNQSKCFPYYIRKASTSCGELIVGCHLLPNPK